MKLKLFYSHAWNDKAGGKVKKLLIFLQESHKAITESNEVWLDKKQIDLGDHINNRIMEGIKQCDIFVIAWSENAFKSQGVLFEIETAARLRKPILVLKIDNTDPNQLSYLAGREYIDFSGDQYSFDQQLIYLDNYLIRKRMDLYKQQPNDPETKEEITRLEQQLEKVQDLLIELEDTVKRQQIYANGNDESDVYIKSQLNSMEKIVDAGTAEGKMMLAFSARMKEISAAYPARSQDMEKKRLALIAVNEIDPFEKNIRLTEFKRKLEQDLK